MNAIPAQEVADHCLQAFTQRVHVSQAAFTASIDNCKPVISDCTA
jgi:hypothetical protein